MLEVGRIGRSHGLGGEVVVHLTTSERSRLDRGSVLQAGDRTLVVTSARPHQQRWVVKFDGIDDRAGADELRGTTLAVEGPPDDDDPDALWIHELIGARVVDPEGTDHGRIEAVQQNPASDVLVLDSGALVPLTFAVGWEVRGELLRIDPPEGLFEL
jgi:16S rRNA processing protein RimM